MKKSFGHAARKTSIFGLAWTLSTTFKISVVANAKKDNRQTCVATRSRITHFMNKFRTMGLIDYNGELTVRTDLLTDLLFTIEVVSPPPPNGIPIVRAA
jgi:hypothetical protein